MPPGYSAPAGRAFTLGHRPAGWDRGRLPAGRCLGADIATDVVPVPLIALLLVGLLTVVGVSVLIVVVVGAVIPATSRDCQQPERGRGNMLPLAKLLSTRGSRQ